MINIIKKYWFQFVVCAFALLGQYLISLGSVYEGMWIWAFTNIAWIVLDLKAKLYGQAAFFIIAEIGVIIGLIYWS